MSILDFLSYRNSREDNTTDNHSDELDRKICEINKFAQELYSVASRDTAYPTNQADWTEDNRFFGHCAIVVAMVYDKFGGKIKRGVLKNLGYSHYWNNIDGIDIDATRVQFGKDEPITDISEVSIERILGNAETKSRYELLKHRYEEKYLPLEKE